MTGLAYKDFALLRAIHRMRAHQSAVQAEAREERSEALAFARTWASF
jgi:hypothetical protein